MDEYLNIILCKYNQVKMWGPRWALITEIHPQSAKITHLINHPNGRAVLSFSADQTIFAWSLDSKLKVINICIYNEHMNKLTKSYFTK